MELDEADETFTFSLETEPTALLPDPDTWLLMESQLTRR